MVLPRPSWREAAGVHEAGHVLAAVFHGVQVNEVTAGTDRGGAYTSIDTTVPQATAGVLGTIGVAGNVAELVIYGRTNAFLPRADLLLATQKLQPADETWPFIQRYEREAKPLMERFKWAVIGFAKALLQTDKMTGADVDRFFFGADNASSNRRTLMGNR
jgi:hypothetical protein